MSEEVRLLIVVAVAALAALGAYGYWAREKRLQTKSDGARRTRREQARQITEPKVEEPSLKLKAQAFGRR